MQKFVECRECAGEFRSSSGTQTREDSVQVLSRPLGKILEEHKVTITTMMRVRALRQQDRYVKGYARFLPFENPNRSARDG